MEEGKLKKLLIAGIFLIVLSSFVLAMFFFESYRGLYKTAPEPEESWKDARLRGLDITNHSQAFKAVNITKYEGSKTCLKCHEKEVRDFAHSIHYRMASLVSDIENHDRVLIGGRFIYDDFCGAIFWKGNVSVNFIGKAILKKAPAGKEELKGTLIATGCSMCHSVTLGRIPSMEPTKEDYENIDCLACHHGGIQERSHRT